METENKSIDFSFLKENTNKVKITKEPKDIKKITKFLIMGATMLITFSSTVYMIHSYRESEKQLQTVEKRMFDEKIKLNYLNNYLEFSKNKKEIIQNLINQLTIYDKAVNIYIDFNNELYFSNDSIKNNSEIRVELQNYRVSIYQIINNLNTLTDKTISKDNNDLLDENLTAYSVGSLNRSNDLEAMLTKNMTPTNQDNESNIATKKKYDNLMQQELSNILRPTTKITSPKM